MEMDERHKVIIPKKSKYLIGIDEAGRGALAGPVAVGAVIWSQAKLPALRRELRDYPAGRDSKKLTPKQREFWFKQLLVWRAKGWLDFQVALVGAPVIDRRGINVAVRLGIARNLIKLRDRQAARPAACRLLLDGGLVAPAVWPDQETIIRGDERELIITLASIVAKVTRDRLMVCLAQIYPDYEFQHHKGYGTVRHYQALARLGLTPSHRRSYLKKLTGITKNATL